MLLKVRRCLAPLKIMLGSALVCLLAVRLTVLLLNSKAEALPVLLPPDTLMRYAPSVWVGVIVGLWVAGILLGLAWLLAQRQANTNRTQTNLTLQQVEAALRQREEQFRVVAETAACAFMVYQGSHLRYVNPAAEAITEYSRDELLQMDFWDLAHPDFRSLVQQRGLARQRGEAVTSRYEIKIMTRSGKERWVDLTAGPICLEGQPAALATAYDITDRKLAEEHLRFAAERERLLSEVALRIHGSLNLEEILNTTVAEIRRFLRADRVLIAQIDQAGYSHTVAESVDPQWPPIIGWTADPTAVRELKALFEPRVSQHRPETNRIRIVNDVQQIEKTPFLAEYYDRCQVRAAMGIALMLNGEMFGVLIANQCSGPRQWQSSEIDVFEQLATQVEIAIQQGQLYQQVQTLAANLESQVDARTAELQQRMQELCSLNQVKDLLLHAVSHDLKTPVQGMLMVLNKLRQKCDRDIPVSASMLNLMIQSCDHQLHLLNSLGEDYCANRTRRLLNLAPVNLATISDTVLMKLDALFTNNQTAVNNQIAPDLPSISADATQLEQVFNSLLTNAVKHNPPGQAITLTATVRQMALSAELNGNRQSSASPVLYCTVTDTGKGIAQDQCDRLFQLYVRGVDNCHLTGIGLGLHRCQQIIQAHGGQLGVISCPGSGSKFWFTLPVQ